MNTKSQKFIAFAENKMVNELIRFSEECLSIEEAQKLATEIVSKIDWNNSALMHKGFSWIAKNYLSQSMCSVE